MQFWEFLNIEIQSQLDIMFRTLQMKRSEEKCHRAYRVTMVSIAFSAERFK